MNNLKPIAHMGLSGSVREAIEAAIVQCELAPGTPLVDRHLAAMLNVSRTPVRDAMRQLEPLGLVRRQGRGAMAGWVVAEFRERDVHELFELRRLFEPLGLKRLSGHCDDALTQRLATYFDDFHAPLQRESYEAYIKRDRAFHKEIVTNSGNSRVIHFYEIMEKQMDRIRHFLATGYGGRMDRIVEEHRALCNAIGAHDVEAAIRALTHHLSQGEEAMIVFAHERQLLVDDL
jgi:GntR family transcriptional regulator, rspAB operon transcriptional repressor